MEENGEDKTISRNNKQVFDHIAEETTLLSNILRRKANCIGHRREDNISVDFREVGINMRDWVDLAQDRDYWRALVNAALNLRVP